MNLTIKIDPTGSLDH